VTERPDMRHIATRSHISLDATQLNEAGLVVKAVK
jgi:hypothetical protein